MSAERNDDNSLAPAVSKLTDRPVSHLLFQETRDALEEAWQSHDLVLLCGASGVGKGRLVEAVVEELNREVGADRRRVRAVVVRTMAPTQNRFSWRDQSFRILDALGDPLPERKTDREGAADRKSADKRGCNESLPPGRLVRGGEEAVLRSVRKAADGRGLQLLVLDEAYNLVNGVRGRRLANQLDVLRDLADQTSFRVVLVSTERILSNLDLSPELSRRLGFVYFPRYGAPLDAHGRLLEPRARLKEFSKAARELMERLPESARLSLSKEQHRSLFEGSHGCVGRLVDWFQRAIVRCVTEGGSSLGWEHFQQTGEPYQPLAAFREKCREHEKRVLEERALGHARVPDAGEEIAAKQQPLFSSEADASARPRRRSGRVGTPNPARHAGAGPAASGAGS